MIIAIPKELKDREARVSLVPREAATLRVRKGRRRRNCHGYFSRALTRCGACPNCMGRSATRLIRTFGVRTTPAVGAELTDYLA